MYLYFKALPYEHSQEALVLPSNVLIIFFRKSKMCKLSRSGLGIILITEVFFPQEAFCGCAKATRICFVSVIRILIFVLLRCSCHQRLKWCTTLPARMPFGAWIVSGRYLSEHFPPAAPQGCIGQNWISPS